MTDATDQRGTTAFVDHEWWNSTIGQTVRTVWHCVGFYAAVVPLVKLLASVLVVGAVAPIWSVPSPVAVSILLAAGLAVVLSAFRPQISSARTLAFGFLTSLLFKLAQVVFGQPAIAGRPLVAVDVVLAAVSAVSLAAVAVYGFDWPDRFSGTA